MDRRFPLLGLLKKPANLIVFLVVFGLIFYFNYYLMVHLVGARDLACMIGAGFTPFNVFFAFLMSALAGMLVIGFLENQRNRSALSRVKIGSSSFFGLTLGTLTSFCTLCSLPALTFFGSSLSLGFLTDYELYFKLLSLMLLGLGIYMVNRELVRGCNRCIN